MAEGPYRNLETQFPGHLGEALPADVVYAIPAPHEIGTVVSAGTNQKRAGDTERSSSDAKLLTLAYLLSTMVMVVVLMFVFERRFVSAGVLAVLVVGSLAVVRHRLRLKPFCSYVGDKGTWSSADGMLLFAEVSSMSVTVQDVIVNDEYALTRFQHTWFNGAGEKVFELKTAKYPDETIAGEHLFALATAQAFSRIRISRARNQILNGGAVFSLGAGRSVTVKVDRLIFFDRGREEIGFENLIGFAVEGNKLFTSWTEDGQTLSSSYPATEVRDLGALLNLVTDLYEQGGRKLSRSKANPFQDFLEMIEGEAFQKAFVKQ